jgi:hypothetical protein
MANLIIPTVYPRNVGDTCMDHKCERDDSARRCERCDFKSTWLCKVVGCSIPATEVVPRIPIVWVKIPNTYDDDLADTKQ